MSLPLPALSIRARIALTATAVVASALLLFAVVAFLAVDRTLMDGVDALLDDEILEIVTPVESRGVDRRRLLELVADENAEHLATGIAFRALDGATGALIASASALPWDDAWPRRGRTGDAPRLIFTDEIARLPPRETVRGDHGGAPWRVARRRIDGAGTGPVLIETALRMDGTTRTLDRLLRMALLALPLGVALSLGAGLLVAGRALGPLAALDAAAQGIGRGAPSVHLPSRGTGDEVDRLAATLDDMLERLEAAAARNRRFAADVAHELRTPLAALRLRVESSALDEAQAIIARIEAVISSLLLICSADEGALAARMGPCDLATEARSALEFFAPLAEAKGGSVSLDPIAAPVPAVHGDRISLGRAIANLVDNAIRYGGERPEVSVAVVHEAGRVRVLVRDRGPGVAEATRPRIFERFFRARGAGSDAERGSGLGLSLVLAIARAHGGDARHEPREGGGSVFSLEVPVAPV